MLVSIVELDMIALRRICRACVRGGVVVVDVVVLDIVNVSLRAPGFWRDGKNGRDEHGEAVKVWCFVIARVTIA